MRKRFRFVHVEQMVDRIGRDPSIRGDRSAFDAFNGRLRYRNLIPTRPLNPDTSCVLGNSTEHNAMKRQWQDCCGGNVFLGSGAFEFSDFVVFGRFGLMLDPVNDVALVGGSLHMNVPLACYCVSICPPEFAGVVNEDQTGFEIDWPQDMPTESNPAILMMSPGQDVYGHWLLDFAPRLMLAGLMHSPGISRYHFENVPRWSAPLLEAFGVPLVGISASPRPQFVRYLGASSPSGTKEGFRVAQPVSRMAWLRLKHRLLETPITDEEAARLPDASHVFVSRKGLTDVRTIPNADRLEDLAVARGFVSIRPEQFSLPAQARIFNRARCVLGEDGSGLHNIIFAEPGCVLGLVHAREPNLWHIAICQQLGHFLGSLAVGDDGMRPEREAEYNALIDTTLSRVTAF